MGKVDNVTATEQDHEAVYRFLAADSDRADELDAPHRAASKDPYYHPGQRHIGKVDGEIVSHVHAPQRVTRIGIAEVKIGGIMWVQTAPEHRLRNHARHPPYRHYRAPDGTLARRSCCPLDVDYIERHIGRWAVATARGGATEGRRHVGLQRHPISPGPTHLEPHLRRPPNTDPIRIAEVPV